MKRVIFVGALLMAFSVSGCSHHETVSECLTNVDKWRAEHLKNLEISKRVSDKLLHLNIKYHINESKAYLAANGNDLEDYKSNFQNHRSPDSIKVDEQMGLYSANEKEIEEQLQSYQLRIKSCQGSGSK